MEIEFYVKSEDYIYQSGEKEQQNHASHPDVMCQKDIAFMAYHAEIDIDRRNLGLRCHIVEYQC